MKSEKMTFGDLKGGEHFTLTKITDENKKFISTIANVKLVEEGVSLKEEFKNLPFNVVSFDGRFRTFRDHEEVYKLYLDN